MATVHEVLRHADTLLRKVGVEEAQRDSRLLLSRVLNRELAWILSHGDAILADSERTCFLKVVEQRASGRPLAYITGLKEFFGRQFVVSPDVLIPRPETEMLVEQGISIFRERGRDPLFLADIGTGSGCIAVSLAAEIFTARVIATDISDAALAVARQNARQHGVAERIEFTKANLLPAATADLDAIFSNPPYVCEQDPLLSEEVRRHEPGLALFAAREGLALYEEIVPLARQRLRNGGWLFLELGYTGAEKVRQLFGSGWSELKVVPDLQGIPRCLIARTEVNPAAI